MTIVDFRDKEFVPASHEDQNDPGVMKKVLLSAADFSPESNLRMLNYSLMKPGRSFKAHFHKTLEEFYYLISGKAEILMEDLDENDFSIFLDKEKSLKELLVDAEKKIIEAGAAVLIPPKTIHLMKNVGDEDLIYLAVGAATGEGETVNLE
jgi:oxalate decarboxylase/phosphoglucose isomerase-like protein (cupin superfamily)